jgi:hypothetical protein
MIVFAQAAERVGHGQPFYWNNPNWGWLFLGMIIGVLIHAAITRAKGG